MYEAVPFLKSCHIILCILFLYTAYIHVGKPVMVVNGAYRGLRAIMEGLNTDSFSVTIKIDQVCHLHMYTVYSSYHFHFIYMYMYGGYMVNSTHVHVHVDTNMHVIVHVDMYMITMYMYMYM